MLPQWTLRPSKYMVGVKHAVKVKGKFDLYVSQELYSILTNGKSPEEVCKICERVTVIELPDPDDFIWLN